MLKGAIWEILGKFGSQIISFLITILLARYLSPAEYGIMGMCMAVIGVAAVFMDLGFKSALIQSKSVTNQQYSTVFYINGAIAVFLFLCCFFAAQPLADFYRQPQITHLFKVLSLNFLFNGFCLVPSAILYKNLEFRKANLSSLIVAIVSGATGFLMAFKGFGIWSLVAQSLAYSGGLLVLYFVMAGWKPMVTFSINAIRPLWRYGNRMFASSILETIFTRVDTFIIGKCFSVDTLGYYSRAQGTDNMVRTVSANSILGVIFPYVAKYQNDKPFLKQLYRRYLNVVMFLAIGISGALYLTGLSIFRILFTAKWDAAVGLFQIMAIGSFAWPVSSLMCNVIAAVGNSKAFLRLEIYKKALFVPIYLLGFILSVKGYPWAMNAFVWAIITGYYISVVFNAYYTERETGVGLWLQLRIMFSYLVVGAIATVLTYLIAQYLLPDPHPKTVKTLTHFYIILVDSVVFSGIYLMLAYLLRLEGIELIQIAARKIKQILRK